MSTVSGINGATGTSADTEAPVIPQKMLNQNDFFKLLIAQMTAQDPMNPMSNEDFMGQMAQFSSLEQTRSMGDTISSMRDEQQMLQANSLIGRDVNLQIDTGVVHGTVTAVQMDGTTPKIVVGDAAYDLSQVLTITASSPAL
ncbi:MAG TPA: flagellar hook capping FlgD N-terminal domain-containing protein [Verrucomicrobiae bacterium]|jgi:flagellar basal-body rod modification protein FlgD